MSGKKSKDLLASFLGRISTRIKTEKPAIFLILLSACYTLLAYRGGGLTIGGDCLIPFHSTEYLTRLPFLSDPWAGLGSSLPPIFSLPPLPDTLMFSGFALLGLDIYTANRLYMFVLSTISASSIYCLSTTIFHDRKNRSWIGAVAAFAYLFNPWVFADTYKTMIFMELSLVQSGFILFTTFVIKYLRSVQLRHLLYAGLCTLLMFSYPGISAYRLALVASLCYAYGGLYRMICSGKSKLKSSFVVIFKGATVLATLGFLFNGYWTIPFIRSAGDYASFASEFQPTTIFNQYSNMINTLRLLNSWSFYGPFVPYSETYLTDQVSILLTFSWPILAFVPLLSKSVNKTPRVLAFYLATFLTILLSWGSEFPLGHLYMAVANIHVGSFYFLRPFYNTGIFSQLVLTVEYAVLIGLSSSLAYSLPTRKLQGLISRKRAFGAILLVAMITGVLAASSWPILTGEVMRNWYDPKQYGVKVPAAYWDANKQLEAIGDLSHKTLLLPRPDVYVGTSWGYQGTSHFYSLMFNTPLVTGNEVPYGISINRTTLNNIYSVPYKVPDGNDTVDVMNQTKRIIPWQNDIITLGVETVTIDFNNTFELDKWHQVEFGLLSSEDWSNLTHLAVRLSANMDFERFQLGVGDTNGYVGWWNTADQTYQKRGDAYLPVETNRTITTYDGSVDILLDLKKPQRSTYSMSNVTSVWMQYRVTPSIGTNMRIEELEAIKATVDSLHYARFLAENEVKFLLVDFSIVEGATSDPALWLQMLSNSNHFSLIWQQDQLYIFENLVI
jgi:hypothetical protein